MPSIFLKNTFYQFNEPCIAPSSWYLDCKGHALFETNQQDIFHGLSYSMITFGHSDERIKYEVFVSRHLKKAAMTEYIHSP